VPPAQAPHEVSKVKIEGVPYTHIDWAELKPTEQAGTTGKVTSRMVETGNLRIRTLEFSPGYMADHWCERGHVVYVLDGEVVHETSDGKMSVLTAGQSYAVSDGAPGHRTFTRSGAKVFILD
jgi:quercetin dioxygenase-like cupin family protein